MFLKGLLYTCRWKCSQNYFYRALPLCSCSCPALMEMPLWRSCSCYKTYWMGIVLSNIECKWNDWVEFNIVEFSIFRWEWDNIPIIYSFVESNFVWDHNHLVYNINDSSLNFYIIINNHTYHLCCAVWFQFSQLDFWCFHVDTVAYRIEMLPQLSRHSISWINMKYLKFICNETEQLTEGLRLREVKVLYNITFFFLLGLIFLRDLQWNRLMGQILLPMNRFDLDL